MGGAFQISESTIHVTDRLRIININIMINNFYSVPNFRVSEIDFRKCKFPL